MPSHFGGQEYRKIQRMITWHPQRARPVKCIAVRYTRGVTTEITTEEYRALAELRYRIRHFLREGDAVAQAAGLEPQQYLLLLTIRGLPAGEEATIRNLAERLALKHHSVVELIDRLETHGYVRRTRGREDRRRVLVSLLPRGERLLEQVVRHRIGELRSNGHELVRAIDQLLEKPAQTNRKKHSGEREKRA
jgi:DNA-binding MarR family transcriptional regulator